MNARVRAQSLSSVQLFATPWTVAHQAPLSMEFSRQEYWSELPFPPPGDLPDPGIKPMSLVPPTLTDSLLLSHQGSPPPCVVVNFIFNLTGPWGAQIKHYLWVSL